MRSIDWLHAIFNASLLRTIFCPLLAVTAYASIVAGLDLVLDWRWELTNQITPLLSVLLGLLLVFRQGPFEFTVATRLTNSLPTGIRVPTLAGTMARRYSPVSYVHTISRVCCSG